MEHARKLVSLSSDNVRRIQRLFGKDGTLKTVQTPGTAKKRLEAQMNDILNSADDKKENREKWNDDHCALQKFLLLSSYADEGNIASPSNVISSDHRRHRHEEQSKDDDADNKRKKKNE